MWPLVIMLLEFTRTPKMIRILTYPERLKTRPSVCHPVFHNFSILQSPKACGKMMENLELNTSNLPLLERHSQESRNWSLLMIHDCSNMFAMKLFKICIECFLELLKRSTYSQYDERIELRRLCKVFLTRRSGNNLAATECADGYSTEDSECSRHVQDCGDVNRNRILCKICSFFRHNDCWVSDFVADS